jgi:glutamate carboxypeptidase
MALVEDYIRDLKEITSFDSGSRNIEGVARAASIMKRHYDSIGFATKFVDLGPNAGPGLFATNKPDADHYDILLNAHLDTVFPDGTAAKRPFRIEGDRIYAPGCMDCKGGVVAFFYALKTLPSDVMNRLSIAVACNPDEESGSVYSHEWLSSLAKQCDRALVGEPGRPDDSLIQSRKGIRGYVVKFHGKASHAGNHPEEGRDANIALMKFTLEAYKLNDLAHGVSVSPTVMQGGSIRNAISDASKIYLDTRFLRDEQIEKLDRELRELASRTWVDEVTAELTIDHGRPAMPKTEKTEELIRLVNQAAKMAGFDAKWVDAGGGSDAAYMAAAGIPAVDGCGPAGGGAHSPNEYLRIDTIEERITMIRNVLTLL